MTDTASTETSVPEAAKTRDDLICELADKLRATKAELKQSLRSAEFRDVATDVWWRAEGLLGAAAYALSNEREARLKAEALTSLAPSDAERERVIEGMEHEHFYSPSYLHMGDCAECGNSYDAPLHHGTKANDKLRADAIDLLRIPSPLPHVETGGERERCARSGPCSDNGDGCSCSDSELAARTALRAPVETGGERDDDDEQSLIHRLGAMKGVESSEFEMCTLNDAIAALRTPPHVETGGERDTVHQLCDLHMRLLAAQMAGDILDAARMGDDIVLILDAATKLDRALRAPVEAAPAGVRAVAWLAYFPGAGSIDSVTRTTHSERIADQWKAAGGQITPLCAIERPQP